MAEWHNTFSGALRWLGGAGPKSDKTARKSQFGKNEHPTAPPPQYPYLKKTAFVHFDQHFKVFWGCFPPFFGGGCTHPISVKEEHTKRELLGGSFLCCVSIFAVMCP